MQQDPKMLSLKPKLIVNIGNAIRTPKIISLTGGNILAYVGFISWRIGKTHTLIISETQTTMNVQRNNY